MDSLSEVSTEEAFEQMGLYWGGPPYVFVRLSNEHDPLRCEKWMTRLLSRFTLRYDASITGANVRRFLKLSDVVCQSCKHW